MGVQREAAEVHVAHGSDRDSAGEKTPQWIQYNVTTMRTIINYQVSVCHGADMNSGYKKTQIKKKKPARVTTTKRCPSCCEFKTFSTYLTFLSLLLYFCIKMSKNKFERSIKSSTARITKRHPEPVGPAVLPEHVLLRSPETVEDVAIGEDSQHDVVRGGVVDERALGMHKEHVRNPYFLHQAAVKGHALVGGARKRQPLVLPVVT